MLKASIPILIILLSIAHSHELCKDNTGPSEPTESSFCSMYNERSCCSIDDNVEEIFSKSNVNGSCGEIYKRVLCADCDPWGAHLFSVEDQQDRHVPWLCMAYCHEIWDACKDVYVEESVFNGTGMLKDDFGDGDGFCEVFGRDGGYCYSGVPFEVPESEVVISDKVVCLEKVLDGRWIGMEDIDGERYFVYDKDGLVYIVDGGLNVFLDIHDLVVSNGEKGLLGMALHPDYMTNGLFYLHYSCRDCDSVCDESIECYFGECSGVCANVNHISTIEEYKFDIETWSSAVSSRIIYQNQQRYANHNGGQILFGADGYLYIMFGDSGSGNDPTQQAQNLNTPLGVILRIDVDNSSDGNEYSIPSDNPFVGEDGVPEIYAYGLRNPWRCSFDKVRPSYFVCGDVGQNAIEEIDLIIKGGNYGWRKYEGTRLNFANDEEIEDHIPPILEYAQRNENPRLKSVTGGYFYRGSSDPSLYGLYVYADLYGTLFAAEETPYNSGKFTSTYMTPYSSSGVVTLEDIWSFGEDKYGELYILVKTGIYKTIDPSNCVIPTETVSASTSPLILSIFGLLIIL